MQAEYKILSKRTRLMLQKQEGFDVDFKQSLSGLETSDLVAFANSEQGGTILVGVDEVDGIKGVQRGKVVGCKITDGEKLKILNKAEECIPPVEINIFIENLNYLPIFRIEIPPGKEKPYCTRKGLYTVRGDGRTMPLIPERLLSLFLEKQGEKFIDKFRVAASSLENQLDQLKDKMDTKLNDIYSSVDEMEIKLQNSLESIFYSASSAEELSDEAMSFSDEALGLSQEIIEKVNSLEEIQEHDSRKIDELLSHFGIEDPWIKQVRNSVKNFVKIILQKQPKIRNATILKQIYSTFPTISQSELSKWVKEAKDELMKDK